MKAVIHAVNSVADFGQPSNRGIDGALAYGFFAELLGASDNFWSLNNSAEMDDFLSEVFECRFPRLSVRFASGLCPGSEESRAALFLRQYFNCFWGRAERLWAC